MNAKQCRVGKSIEIKAMNGQSGITEAASKIQHPVKPTNIVMGKKWPYNF